ncbi:hypothetical protein M3Y98_00537900 [Aphelenchoides besseyi]|nr:hypothetical protein M3Y98_00537900 [Aphelenchoides besseyi]KAI6208106.1 hypothetical protein M3Y96_00079600 [Aphelenchoides besseyi]
MTQWSVLHYRIFLFSLLVITSFLIVSSVPLTDQRPVANGFFTVERRGLHPNFEEGAERNADRPKNFGVGNNFVRHLRLLSRMSKKDQRAYFDNFSALLVDRR